MILHARKCTFHPRQHQYWRGLRPFMQLHEKRHMKRAGEAGVVLRAIEKTNYVLGKKCKYVGRLSFLTSTW
ncbi:hypothetical protein FR965_23815 [Serratia marcescens]|nr:hypothetical protein FR965_23815 [Serratia marcescens]